MEIRLPVFEIEFGKIKTKVEKVTNEAQKTLVATNNHYKGQAAVNAIELKKMLGGKKIKAPKPLVEHYPEQLSGIADPA